MKEMKPEREENKEEVSRGIELPFEEDKDVKEKKDDYFLEKSTDIFKDKPNPLKNKKRDLEEDEAEEPRDGDLDKELQELKDYNPGFWADEKNADEENPSDEADYEARRNQRLERMQKRKKKRVRRKRMAGAAVVLLVLLGTGVYFREDVMKQAVVLKDGLSKAVQRFQSEKKPDEQSIAANGTGDEKEEPSVTPTPASINDSKEVKRVVRMAKNYATQYDFDKAIEVLTKDPLYDQSSRIQKAAMKYKKQKASCVAWSPEQVTHVFYHSLIVDPVKAFDGDYKADGYNQVMTTVNEFNQITQTMYERGYVMVSLYDLAQVDENGVMTAKEILLPEGKIPFVLSQDDLSYYHCMDGDGFATKLIVDEQGKVRNEYVEDDGSISVGDYDVVPLIDRFVEEHPDFSYKGAKGTIALTGYNGILGYRTDISYETRPDDLDDDKVAWLNAHPDFSLEEQRQGAKTVADAMKAEGWTFASHTWGHKNMSEVSMERLQTDTQNFKENVDPIIGGTDIIIFAFGADINSGEDYSGEKFDYLKSQGYNYYCNVDSSQYYVQVRDNYFRMGRRNLDGYRMYYNPEMLEDLFDAQTVFDSSRPTPVPPMGSGE